MGNKKFIVFFRDEDGKEEYIGFDDNDRLCASVNRADAKVYDCSERAVLNALNNLHWVNLEVEYLEEEEEEEAKSVAQSLR